MSKLWAKAISSIVSHDNDLAIPRIISFVSRRDGWNFGHGMSPPTNVLIKALLIAKAVDDSGIRESGAFLNDDGSIMVTGYFDAARHVELTSEVAGAIRIVVEDNGDVIADDEYVNLESGRQRLIEQVRKWGNVARSPEFTTSTTLISNWRYFRVAPSPLHPLTAEYPLSAQIALLPPAALYVPISDSTTMRLPAIPQFSGNSAALTFRVTLG